MGMVGGLDLHRGKVTFDVVDTECGRVLRGRIAGASGDVPRLAGPVRRAEASNRLSRPPPQPPWRGVCTRRSPDVHYGQPPTHRGSVALLH
jgi:hypothetical protein